MRHGAMRIAHVVQAIEEANQIVLAGIFLRQTNLERNIRQAVRFCVIAGFAIEPS